MTEQPRDWDRELANIDRAIGKQPAATPSATATGPSAPVAARRFVALTWFWTVLAVILALALPLWPYDQSCGLRLVFYLGAAGIAVLVGVLGTIASWSHRQGLAHMLCLLVIAWAGVMVAREVLPRAGYARESRDWVCAAQPAASPAPTPAPAPAPADH
jgi:hypothetical protein